mgnify:CR=1 FL=1
MDPLLSPLLISVGVAGAKFLVVRGGESHAAKATVQQRPPFERRNAAQPTQEGGRLLQRLVRRLDFR